MMAELNSVKSEDEIVRDVFDTEEIETKTELRTDQIEKINKLKTMGTIFGCNILKVHLKDFMTLQKSKDRRSMEEFVTSIKAKREDMVKGGQTFFKKMMG